MVWEPGPGETPHYEGDGHHYYVSGEGENIKVRGMTQQTAADAPFMSMGGFLAMGMLIGWPVVAVASTFMHWGLGWGGSLAGGVGLSGLVAVFIGIVESSAKSDDHSRIKRVQDRLIAEARRRAEQERLYQAQRREEQLQNERDRVAEQAAQKLQEERSRQQAEAEAAARKREQRAAELEAKLLDLYADFAYSVEIANPGISKDEVIRQFARGDVLAKVAPEGDGRLLRDAKRPLARKLYQAIVDGTTRSMPGQPALPSGEAVLSGAELARRNLERYERSLAAGPKDSATAQYEARLRESAERRRKLNGD